MDLQHAAGVEGRLRQHLVDARQRELERARLRCWHLCKCTHKFLELPSQLFLGRLLKLPDLGLALCIAFTQCTHVGLGELLHQPFDLEGLQVAGKQRGARTTPLVVQPVQGKTGHGQQTEEFEGVQNRQTDLCVRPAKTVGRPYPEVYSVPVPVQFWSADSKVRVFPCHGCTAVVQLLHCNNFPFLQGTHHELQR